MRSDDTTRDDPELYCRRTFQSSSSRTPAVPHLGVTTMRMYTFLHAFRIQHHVEHGGVVIAFALVDRLLDLVTWGFEQRG